MTHCIRKGIFRLNEIHKCFVCGKGFSPGKSETCLICNWKKCEFGHCGCSVSKEMKLILDKFYDLFCVNKYSNETKYALNIMLKCYLENCYDKG